MSDTSFHVIKNEPDDALNYLNLFGLSKEDVMRNSSSLVWKEESFEEHNNSSPSSGGILKEEEQEYEKYSSKTENVDENCPVIPENITVKVERDVEEYNKLEVSLNEEVIEEHNIGYKLIDLKTFEGHNNSIENEQRNNTELFKCSICPYKTRLKRCLAQHFNRKHITGTELFKWNLCPYESQVKAESDKGCESVTLFKCDICPRTIFKRKRSLIEHFDRNHREHMKLLKCDRCEYETKVKCNLTMHIVRKHREHDEIFKCQFCSFESKVKEYLQKHFNYNHSGNMKFFKCVICPYETKHKSNLKKHINVKHKAPALAESDKDESTFLKCVICPYKTKWKTHLERHINKGHSHKAQTESSKNESNTFSKCNVSICD